MCLLLGLVVTRAGSLAPASESDVAHTFTCRQLRAGVPRSSCAQPCIGHSLRVHTQVLSVFDLALRPRPCPSSQWPRLCIMWLHTHALGILNLALASLPRFSVSQVAHNVVARQGSQCPQPCSQAHLTGAHPGRCVPPPLCNAERWSRVGRSTTTVGPRSHRYS